MQKYNLKRMLKTNIQKLIINTINYNKSINNYLMNIKMLNYFFIENYLFF